MEENDENILSALDLPIDVPDITLGQIFFQSLRSHNLDNIISVESETGRSITSGEFLKLSIQLAEGLRDAGLQQGNCVALIGKNRINISIAAVATLFLGASVSPMDPTMKPYELLQMLKVVEPKVLFCDMEVVDHLSHVLPHLKYTVTVGLLTWDPDAEYEYPRFDDFLKTDLDIKNFSPTPSEDISRSLPFLLWSSGTTGLPKAVMLSDKSFVYLLMVFKYISQRKDGYNEPLVLLHCSHFFWMTGITILVHSLCSGQSRIIVADPTSKNILTSIDKYKPNYAFFVPSTINSLIHAPDFENYDLSSMRIIVSGGASLQKVTYDNLLSKWSSLISVTHTYGLTEMCGPVTTGQEGMDIASVGTLVPGCKLKILRTDGSNCGPREEGEICVKSPTMMNGYMKNKESTMEVIDHDGWLHTGDIGYYIDKNIYVSGRIKEMIKYQGMQIYPVELEELIAAIPGVYDVGVAGIKIDSYTYHPIALVVKTENSDVTEEDIIKCVNENLSDYKKLRGGVCFIEQIPRTTTGKIKRKALQLLAEAMYLGDQHLECTAADPDQLVC